MKLKLYTSNRLEILADELAAVVHAPLSSPLAPEIIMVQSRGMARWVSMSLARQLGIAANLRFPFPNHFIQELFERIIPGFSAKTCPDPTVMAWMIMARLPELLSLPALLDIERYLDGDGSCLKRYQLSEKIAALFDQYLIYRADMVSGWDHGKDNSWQATLWRSLAATFGQSHRAALFRTFLDEIRKMKTPPEGLPERISIFGISSLPPYHLKILAGLSTLTEVNLFLMNPCREYWADIVSSSEMRRQIRKVTKGGKHRATGEDLHLEKGNSLLASMGMLGRDFFSLIHGMDLGDGGCEENERFIDPGEDSLLTAIQSDILNLRERSHNHRGKETEPITLRPEDQSIQVHSCHTPMREIEVLQDALLLMLDADPSLTPRDILVMTPDIESYAPFVQAVFSVPSDDSRRLPFSIADRGARRESPYLEAFLDLLTVYESRFGAAQIVGLMDHNPVRRRFSLSEDDPEAIRRWVHDAGIRWGVDAGSREEAGSPGFADNSWQNGIERMLLGYALPGRDALFQGRLPFDAPADGDFQALGRFLEFSNRLFTMASSLSESRTLASWADCLIRIADDFLSVDGETEAEALLLRRTLLKLKDLQSASGFNEMIPFTPVQYHLKNALEREGFGSGFLTGGITFCAMLPMRSIPFKVICLIGMNDTDYPRQEQPLGFDLMARHPQIGDRSHRSDDRYLFLEALLSARDCLYISYVGQSAQDNSARPPSVLLSELMDYIEQGFHTPQGPIRDVLTTCHHLQAFDPRYFQPESASVYNKYASYSRENCEAAQHILSMRGRSAIAGSHRFLSSALPEPDLEIGQDWRTIRLEDLCRFFSHPARFFLNKRLHIRLGELDQSPDEHEPFELEGLEKYKIEQWLVGKGLQGIDLKNLWPVVRATGKLPPGSPGECIYDEVSAEAEDFIGKVLPYTRAGLAEPLDIDASIGDFHITGRIAPLCPEGLLYLRYARFRAADRLRAWINHLILNLVCEQNMPPRCTILCRDFEGAYAPVAEPETILRSLLDLYRQGLLRPIPFIPEVSWIYAEALQKGKTAREALTAAEHKWYGNDFSNGVKDDPYYELGLKGADPLNAATPEPDGRESFRRLAELVYNPLLAHLGGNL